jgi:glycosyltransferase involved in cell wall biosynthesis
MKLLLCCNEYWPSVGGVQEVMRQIAERMAEAGHDVTVATRVHPGRTTNLHNGVRIEGFDISGNLVVGISGEVDRYRKFVTDFTGDAILIKAAQQWSFDALWGVLDKITVRKVFVPCGFSSFYEPAFRDYFRRMPDILRKFDQLVFYAEQYRDIDFARENGIGNYSIVPNGASEVEFAHKTRQDGRLRQVLGIPATDLLFLTVGAPTHNKGHETVAEAFAKADLAGRGATLILNGDWPQPGARFTRDRLLDALRRMVSVNSMQKGIRLLREAGVRGLMERLFPKPPRPPDKVVKLPASPGMNPGAPIDENLARDVSAPVGRKTVLRLNLPREQVVDAFFEADLFVFASRVEYSPLVLFEAAAAGTPFLTVPVGNASEIVRWTGGGWLCPADVDTRGYVTVSPAILAREIEKGVCTPDYLRNLGAAGRQAWRDRFTWANIAKSYEGILRGETVKPAVQSDANLRETFSQ